MTDRPFLLPLLSLVAGLCSVHLFAFFVPQWILVPCLITVLLGIFAQDNRFFSAPLVILFFTWGNLSLQPFLEPQFTPNHISRFCSSEPFAVEGVIDSRPEMTPNGYRLYIQAENIYKRNACARVTGRLILYVKEGSGTFLTGDRIRFVARLRLPENMGMPGEFDYQRHLAYRQVFVTASVKNGADIVLMKAAAGFHAQRWIDGLAASLGRHIGDHFPVDGGVIRALLLGERGYVPRDLEDAYTKAGINHILSISGFHVSVIALTLYQLLFWLLGRSVFLALHLNLRRTVLLATLPAIVFYLFLSGTAPATVRSVITVAVCILALFVERETDQLNSLMLAAMFILALSPQTLFDISFQLSFLALWGILVLTPIFMKPFHTMREGIWKKGILLFMASLAATVITHIPVAYYFHRTSVAGLVSNFIAVPLLGYGAVVSGFAALPFIHLAPCIADPLLWATELLVRCANILVVPLSNFPAPPFWNPSRTDVFLFYIFLTIFTFTKERRIKTAGCGVAAVVFLGLHLHINGHDKGSVRVTFFSIGQAESTLVIFPDGKTMLIDGGGSLWDGGMDAGERLLGPALWSKGIDSIDYLVLTHPHPDHLKGLIFIARQFRVGEFWESGVPCTSKDYAALKDALARKAVPIRQFNSLTGSMSIGRAFIEPLAPLKAPSQLSPISEDDLNDESLVFRLTFGHFSMLFTGDIGFGTEKLLLAHPDRLRCNVLKVPHHGSRYSSSPDFLVASSPQVALISAGRGNSFGLPSTETLQRLQGRGIAVYRTDQDRTIEVTSDGVSWTVVTAHTRPF